MKSLKRLYPLRICGLAFASNQGVEYAARRRGEDFDHYQARRRGSRPSASSSASFPSSVEHRGEDHRLKKKKSRGRLASPPVVT